MDRETIEKAAKEFCITDKTCPGNRRLAFIAGAQWRINSAWHDARDAPEHKRQFLYQAVRKSGQMFYGINSVADEEEWGFLKEFIILERWAYLDDLLPEGPGKEGGR